MKSLKIIVLMILLSFVVTACSKVPAGYVGVKVHLLGTKKGVNQEELGVGRYWIGWNEELYIFPTFTQNYVWTQDEKEGSENDESITFQTIEGMAVGADIGISYHIEGAQVGEIFQKYRKGINEITDVFLRNMVRDAFVKEASIKPVEHVYGAGKSDLLAAVEDRVKDQVSSIGIVIERIYLIGKLRLPKQVLDSLNSKIEATQLAQKKENEIRTAKAEAQKAIAAAFGKAKSILAIAEANAKANRILAASITPELIKYKSIERWDGKLPTLMGGDSVIPMINIQ